MNNNYKPLELEAKEPLLTSKEQGNTLISIFIFMKFFRIR